MSDTVPNSSPEIEKLKARRDELLRLRDAIQEKLRARPNDFGIRSWWGFVIIGLLIGLMRTSNVWSVLLCGFVFSIAGVFFSIFALDSAEVQSKLAIILHKIGARRLSRWLYLRALTVR